MEVLIYVFLVILVAEYFVAWHVFRLFHCDELCLVAFLCEREAVK